MNVIKIDVEQAEIAVLTGGSDVLGRARTIICEFAARNSTAVRDLLNTHGYILHDGDRPSGERVPVADAPPNTLVISESVRSGTRSLASQCVAGIPTSLVAVDGQRAFD